MTSLIEPEPDEEPKVGVGLPIDEATPPRKIAHMTNKNITSSIPNITPPIKWICR
jgi:hypothetical protein